MTVITIKQASEILNVSEATVRNWVKNGYLHPIKNTKSNFIENEIFSLQQRIESGEIDRLRKRANKIKSAHSFIPDEYINDHVLVEEIENIRDIFLSHSIDLETTLLVLAIKQLVILDEVSRSDELPPAEQSSGKQSLCKDENLFDLERYSNWKRNSVKQEIYDWTRENRLEIDKHGKNPAYIKIYNALTDISHDDTIGIIYQSLLQEGSKSKQGSYYTPKDIVDSIFREYGTQGGDFLDPCCGTGQFLLGAARSAFFTPDKIHGYDIDGIAVRIARINLLLAFPDQEFTPKIFRSNFLTEVANGARFCKTNNLRNSFKLIATNPPWGSSTPKNDEDKYHQLFPHITSGESFSWFLSKSIDLIEEGGHISFILPESILNVKIHSDIRGHILNHTAIDAIYDLGRRFKGVFTPVIRIDIFKAKIPDNWKITISPPQKPTYTISQSRFWENSNFVFDVSMSEQDFEILKTVFNKPHITLKGQAEWALGIVTGDNKKFVCGTRDNGMEPIYKGSDVQKYRLKQPSSYIKFIPDHFQQVAPEKKYRAKEKLIYKFISNKLVFAYDTNQSLTLNSANILIPKLENLPAKIVLAFLNSSFFQFIFSKKFNTHKVLRGDLEKLPFPLLTKEESSQFLSMVDRALKGEDMQKCLDKEVMKIFNLSSKQIEIINQIQYITSAGSSSNSS